MSDTTFSVSSDVKPGKAIESVDYLGKLRNALGRPIEAAWKPKSPLVVCDEDNALLSALSIAFYSHLPLRLSPDVIWITLARGFAIHVNSHAEQLRSRFVNHSGKKMLQIDRPDFLPGKDNPWTEAFEAFNEQLDGSTGGLASLVRADFSTTGPDERAVSHLMAMETFKSYFEYAAMCGCGIPSITLSGTLADWRHLRKKSQCFADFGLQEWINALDPVLAQFESAKAGKADVDFWKSMFRYHSGSGPAVLTGWANVFFPYLKNPYESLFPNPLMKDWKERLEIDDRQDFSQRYLDPQGFGLSAFPACCTSVPLKVYWGEQPAEMRLVGGILGVSQEASTLTIEPNCGWVIAYEEPVDPRFQEADLSFQEFKLLEGNEL